MMTEHLPRSCYLPLLTKIRSKSISNIVEKSISRQTSSKLFAAVSSKSFFRGRLSIAKSQLSLRVSSTSSVLTFVLLLVFTIGLETAVRDARIHSQAPFPLHGITTLIRLGNHQKDSQKRPQFSWPSAIMRELHDIHAIPTRFLAPLDAKQQMTLYRLVSSPAPNATIPSTKRRVVIAHVTDCHLQQCFRAIASIIAYAHVSLRVALIFVDHIAGTSLTSHLHIPDDFCLAPHALVIPVEPLLPAFSQNTSESSPPDWSEFSVVTAAISYPVPTPNLLASKQNVHTAPLGNASPARQNTVVQSYHTTGDESEDSSEDPYRPTIGNTRMPATLDNLVAMDVHVFVTLSEVFWSHYAPRSLQEHYLHETFRPASPASVPALMSASLLGRHRSTRSLKQTDEKLHNTFKIPRMLLRGISPVSRKLLLLKLQSKVRKGVVHPTVIFVHAEYGLGNRLRALGSAMAFARRTDRILVVIWVPDQHLNCRYTDLFVPSDEFVVADAFHSGEPWPFVNNNRTDPAMSKVKWYNYMRVNGVKILDSSEPVLDQNGYHIYVVTCYVIQSPVTPFIIRTTSSFWTVLKSLTPHVNVVRLVDRFESYPVSQMIGIHIRGKSIKTDISGVHARDYTEESSRTTDYWRNLTQVDTFVEEMRRQTADQLFYVAADQKEVFERLENEFPSRVFYTPRDCDSRNRDCLPFALADILLLARCSSLRGSYWSSFSELSTRIGGARFLLAGVDFGRPQG